MMAIQHTYARLCPMRCTGFWVYLCTTCTLMRASVKRACRTRFHTHLTCVAVVSQTVCQYVALSDPVCAAPYRTQE